MTGPRHNAKPDFDVTGDPGDVSTSALSSDTPVQQEAPSPRLHEHRPDAPLRQRSPREVLHRHLWQSRHGTVDGDLAENYHDDVVILSRWGADRGHDGMRRFADKLRRELPDMTFDYDEILVDGDFGFLEWRGHGSDGTRVCDGADSYLVHDGRITAQSIHYIPRRALS